MSANLIFKEAVQFLGGPVAVARLLNVKHYQSVQQMRRARVEHCPIIESASAGKFTCKQLRPDVDWELMRGTKKAA